MPDKDIFCDKHIEKGSAYAIMPTGKKRLQLPFRHLAAGIGEQRNNYYILFDVLYN